MIISNSTERLAAHLWFEEQKIEEETSQIKSNLDQPLET